LNELRWLGSHAFEILGVWFAFSVVVVILWAVVMRVFGESDEARNARRRRESAERAKQRLRATIRDFQATERERALRAYDARANRVVREVLDEDAVAFRLDVPRGDAA
jgi:predicted component of type VI protein secretion system